MTLLAALLLGVAATELLRRCGRHRALPAAFAAALSLALAGPLAACGIASVAIVASALLGALGRVSGERVSGGL